LSGQNLCALLSLPADNIGSQITFWEKNTGNFDPCQMIFVPGLGWIDCNGNACVGPLLVPGEGFFFEGLSGIGSSVTPVTFSGCFVPCSAAYARPILAGKFCFLSRRLLGPTTTDFKDVIGTFESIVGALPKNGDVVYRVDKTGNPFSNLQFGLSSIPHTYHGGEWSPFPPLADLGEPVFVRVKNAPTTGSSCTPALAFKINGVVPARTNNSTSLCQPTASTRRLVVTGSGFNSTETIWLKNGGTIINPLSVTIGPYTIEATFNLLGAATGNNWTVRVKQAGGGPALSLPFEIRACGTPELQVQVLGRVDICPTDTPTYIVAYRNVGEAAITTPITLTFNVLGATLGQVGSTSPCTWTAVLGAGGGSYTDPANVCPLNPGDIRYFAFTMSTTLALGMTYNLAVQAAAPFAYATHVLPMNVSCP
jgi:hypothetical protein